MIPLSDTALASPDTIANRLPADCGAREAYERPRRYLMVMNELGFVYSHFWDLALGIQAAGWEVIIASAGVADPRRALDAGLRFIRLKPTFGIGGPFEETRSFLELRRAIRSTRPDVLHLISLKNCLLGGVLARMEQVPGVLCAITGLGTLFVENRLLYRMLRPVVMMVLRYICSHKNSVLALENPDDERFFVEHRVVAAGRTRVIPGAGVAADAFTPAIRPAGTPVILYVSRMIRNKGVLELVEAAKLLHARGLKFMVHLVGDVDARNPTSLTPEELQSLEGSGFVKWLGKRSDVASLLDQASIFCLPTYYREGLPRSLVEASAAGLPIVTTDVPGCREVVVDGETGCLVPPRDVPALADALSRLIQADELRVRMGIASRKRFEQKFTTPSVLQAFMDCHSALGMPINLL